jgi:thiol-disulfide isomerase/thioredoxin
MSRSFARPWAVTISLIWGIFAPTLALAAKPTAAEALAITPTQEEVDYDRPERAELERCTVESITMGGISGLVVRGPAGQVLRRFLDTNGDNNVDQWCYYKDGIEVYRDIDTDFEKQNARVNECRWLGLAGTRWGIDEDQDGTIDRWKQVSAEEVTSELVGAIRDKDLARFRRLLLSQQEIEMLGLGAKQAEELKAKIAAATRTFVEQASRQKLITRQSEWIHFGGSQPGVIPAGTDGSTKDIIVYDNVTAVVETPAGAEKRHTQIVVGSLVKVQDGWRLIDLPRSLSADATAGVGYFFQAALSRRPETELPPASDSVSEETRKLFDELATLDKALTADKSDEELARIHSRRADVIERLIQSVGTTEERVNWVRQFAETIGAAVTTGAYPDGVRRLETLVESLGKMTDAKETVPIARLRWLQAVKDRDSLDSEADYAKVHQAWIAGLKDFIEEFPASSETAEAMLQLAMAYEFTEGAKDAATWYGRIVKDFPRSEQAKKAAGAQYRIESIGKRISLKGKSIDGRGIIDVNDFSGKVVLLQFWATWCEPCKEDMELIRSLQAKHGKAAFQPIGINLDNTQADAVKFLTEARLGWPQLYEPGGVEDSPLANQLGVLTLPTMILLDQQGRVVNYNLHSGELDAEIRKLLSPTKPASKSTR